MLQQETHRSRRPPAIWNGVGHTDFPVARYCVLTLLPFLKFPFFSSNFLLFLK